MRKAGFLFTKWCEWNTLYMTHEEFTAWLDSKGYRLRRGEDGKIYPCKYLPEWWYLLGTKVYRSKEEMPDGGYVYGDTQAEADAKVAQANRGGKP